MMFLYIGMLGQCENFVLNVQRSSEFHRIEHFIFMSHRYTRPMLKNRSPARGGNLSVLHLPVTPLQTGNVIGTILHVTIP